jgi:hypothetical protein
MDKKKEEKLAPLYLVNWSKSSLPQFVINGKVIGCISYG